MDPEVQESLADWLLSLGDDELILGQRDAEWCGHAPILEEDIAFANLALDELGHAAQYYTLLAELRGEDPLTYPDRLAFWREADAFRNLQLVELPRGDWAFSMLRQYLFDAAEGVRLDALMQCRYAPLAEAAAKIRNEELYHMRHTRAWVRRLAEGTEESKGRLQAALQQLWPYTAQLFAPPEGEDLLVQAGFAAPQSEQGAEWERRVVPYLREIGLQIPAEPGLQLDRSAHTPEFSLIVEEMQSTARLEPGAEW